MDICVLKVLTYECNQVFLRPNFSEKKLKMSWGKDQYRADMFFYEAFLVYQFELVHLPC